MKGLLCKIAAVITASLIIIGTFTGCNNNSNNNSSKENTVSSVSYSYINTEFDSDDLEIGYDETSAVNIKLNKTSAEISGKGANTDGSVVTITDEGVYVVSGELSNGRLVVDAGKKKDIRIILNGAKITCDDNAPLYIKQADKVIITLDENSENVLTDGASYLNDEDDSNVDGALFSRSDLTINGSGKLTVNANYKHGIVCKDDLVIAGGDYNLTAKSGGVYGKDSLRIKNGNFEINAGSNGIKSTNSDENEKGYIYIKDGNFNITSETDGIESVDSLVIDGGEFNLKTGGGSSNASVKQNGERNENWGRWGEKPPEDKMQVPDGNMMPPDNGGQMGTPDNIGQKPNINDKQNNIQTEQVSNKTNDNSSDTNNATETESSSAKGLKADKDIVFNGGKYTVDSSDDSIHSNGNILINNGEANLKSGDDGIHTDENLDITNGKITIEQSYEGVEGVNINITGGEVKINSSDDGINAGGGSDTGMDDRMGRDNFSQSSSEYLLTISGGKIIVNANGDGLDSNGNLIVEGGEIYINGPTNDGNGALDYGDGADAWITGGTIVACGSSGMAENFGEENSKQNSVLHNFDSKISSGTEVKVTDSNGNIILSYTPEKDYQSVVFSSPNLKNGTYTITAGDISDEFTVDSVITSNGNSNRMGGRSFGMKDKNPV